MPTEPPAPTTPPRVDATSVTIGTSQPRVLAQFYSALLGYRISADEPARPGEPPNAGWAQVQPPEGRRGMTINLEYEAAFTRPVWPSQPGEQTATQHLDLWVDDLDAAEAWALECGATLADFQPQPDVRVMLDPDGHPFCLFR